MTNDTITVGLAQISPIWLDRPATLTKIELYVEQAAAQNCDLVCFGEALLPGYPFWVENTDGARFNDSFQKMLFAYYSEQAVDIGNNDLDELRACCKRLSIACYLGTIERAHDRSGHSLYCSLVYIDKNGNIGSCHRKLMPTYEERLVWSIGDGNGLRTHSLEPFTVGGLNCWENWMPLPRSALYAQGEDLHVAAWPGGLHNTEDITKFIAKEARSYVISVSGLCAREDIPDSLPFYDELIEKLPQSMANGGSCVASPTGDWILEPQVGNEGLFIVDLSHRVVRQERQLFDATGHYSRPDVTRLRVNRKRQTIAEFNDD